MYTVMVQDRRDLTEDGSKPRHEGVLSHGPYSCGLCRCGRDSNVIALGQLAHDPREVLAPRPLTTAYGLGPGARGASDGLHRIEWKGHRVEGKGAPH